MGFPTQGSSLQLFFRKHPLGSRSAVSSLDVPRMPVTMLQKKGFSRLSQDTFAVGQLAKEY